MTSDTKLLAQEAATVIKSLMRDLRVSDHIVFVGESRLSARQVLADLSRVPHHPIPPINHGIKP